MNKTGFQKFSKTIIDPTMIKHPRNPIIIALDSKIIFVTPMFIHRSEFDELKIDFTRSKKRRRRIYGYIIDAIFLHSSFIFFSFFSLFPHNLVIHIFEYLEQESRGLSYPWIVSSAQGIPFVLSSLSSPRYFSYPFRFPFSPTASIAGNRDPHARTIERWPARGFTISIVRAEGRREGRGFRLRFFFFFFFFSPPSLCFSSSKFFLFSFPFLWASVRDSFAWSVAVRPSRLDPSILDRRRKKSIN